MLTTQRRMKPSIAKLISPIYPQLKNHSSVLEYEDVRGVKSSVFFLEHTAPEEAGHEVGSKVNVAEARLIVELCSYLLKQETCGPEQITILAMYKGQVQEISRRLRDRLEYQYLAWGRAVGPAHDENDESSDAWMPRVSSVDDFQGEENDIILLSLVRSSLVPEESSIGFLKTSNRVCVALSRARKGLYIFGNAQLLAMKSPLWKGILHQLGQDGLLGSKLVLCCQNHPGDETAIQNAEDFIQVSDGGCSRPCEYQLECGHACSRRCHPGSHETVVCPKLCLKPYDGCSHRCTKHCHGKEGSPCLPCKTPVSKKFPTCGHEQSIPCSVDPSEVPCASPCQKRSPCGHLCPRPCGVPCEESCSEIVRKELPCGHSTKLSCSRDPSTVRCREPCREILPECEHVCGGTCSQCKDGHIPCQEPCKRDLFCGHQCQATCSVPCPPCSLHCEKRCNHSRCAMNCGTPCKGCLEPCSWICRHFRCSFLCYEICQRPRCDHPCGEKLVCGHPCIGLCGEPCPSACRICHPATFDAITQTTLEDSEASDRFIQLLDCGHIFEVDGLDQWMDMDDSAPASSSTAIVLKFCPACRTPIRRAYRYANVVKKKLHQVELVKLKLNGYEKSKMAMDLLLKNETPRALKLFQETIKSVPGLFEAHFGIAQAQCALQQLDRAVAHVRLVAERSSVIAAEVRALPQVQLAKPYDPLFDASSSTLTGTPDFSLTIKCLVLWASALTGLKDFTNAVKLCEIVLRHYPDSEEAKLLKIKAGARVVFHQVLQAVGSGLSARGHWYACPLGHLYVVGECGRPMQTSRCPDCGSTIGGQNHQPAAGNTRSTIDGGA